MKVEINKIKKEDNDFAKALILSTLKEFGACGPGYASGDDELNDMFHAYQSKDCAYYIVKVDGERMGAGGFAPLVGDDRQVCELRKMYLLPETRGKGIGKKLIAFCMAEAKKAGFTQMYLETLKAMTAAQKLYQSYGFEYLENRRGDTGHHSCPIFMMTTL